MGRRIYVTVALALASLLAVTRPVAAHVGGLTDTSVSAPVPIWLTVLTGGAVVGVSFLLTSVVTDHDTIRNVVTARVRLPTNAAMGRWARRGVAVLGVAALAFVLVTAVLGPPDPQENAAILVVWALWWAGFTMSAYLVGNTWPALDPVRTLARVVPGEGRFEYPARLGAWPNVVGLLALVYFEVVTPVASDPIFLGAVVLAYVAIGLVGSWAVGRADWFGRIDPVARVFRVYGRFAPLQWREGSVELRWPGNALVDDARTHPIARGESDTESSVAEPGAAAFVVALLWATTYDGLVATPLWETVATPIVDLGIPPLGLYLVAIVAGYGAFLGIYRLAGAYMRRTGDSYVSASFLRDWFAPALVPIAAGYHLAHFVGYLLTLSPALVAVLASPIAGPPELVVLVLPEWWGSVQLLFVLLGHLLAVWVGHALAFELFPGTLTPLRSQYSLVVAMIVYTMISAWIVTQPFGAPPFV